MPGMILPIFPKALQTLATDRRPAISTTELISNIRQRSTPATKPGEFDLHGVLADVFDRFQKYLDSNGNYNSLVVDYLKSLTKTPATAGGDLSGTLPDPTVIAIQGNAVEDAVPNDGDVLTWVDANSDWEPAAPTEGTVTSVALGLPNIFTVSGSPVTATGTLTGTLATQSANRVFAGPTSGGAATPTFRALVSADFPGTSATVTLAAITGGGTNGSATFTNGILTAYTPPT